MKMDRKFNELQPEEYIYYINNHKKFADFNTLGLYRSILENELLGQKEKIIIRDYANETYGKTYDFLQLKDPFTYYKLLTLGMNLTRGDELQAWENIRKNQQKILAKKKIKHRNFGDYSKHNCGYDHCPYNGLMITQGSPLAECGIFFKSDKNKDEAREKSKRIKKQRKQEDRIIRDEMDEN